VSHLPFLVRRTLGGEVSVESGFPVYAAATAHATVWLPLADLAPAGSPTPAWDALLGAQEFFGRPTPTPADLDRALAAFGAEARTASDDDAVCVAVTVDAAGTVFVTGRSIDRDPTPVALVELAEADDLLFPRTAWQRHALTTTSRAQVDAFARALAERGAADALVTTADGDVRPVVGALLALVDGELRAASPGTTVPPLLQTLAACGHLDAVPPQLRSDELAHAAHAWWVDPGFAAHEVVDLPGHGALARRRLADLLPSPLYGRKQFS
jgi:hypothetical protein